MLPHGFSSQGEFEDALRDGILAARNGSYALARRLLERAGRIQPYEARPWIELAKIARNEAEETDYLEKALVADPYDQQVRRKLALLKGKVRADELLPVGGESPHPESDAVVDAAAKRSFICPQCGSGVAFDLHSDTLRCDACGFERPVEQRRAAGVSEQVLDFVLPTRRGHQWAQAQNRFECRQCGAVSLWPKGQSALQCPYCGTHQLAESAETASLVDPQAIGLMEVDEKKAHVIVRAWLKKDWKAPDDLVQSVKGLSLRPAYYPFWTFDGALRLHWHCEVNEGGRNAASWTPRSGAEIEMFDDVLTPGYRALDGDLLGGILPFRLKEIVAFKPEFLAGWPALAYDVPLVEAVLQARGAVVQQTRRRLYGRVLPGEEKRNLTTGAVEWSGITFNHVLLPVWIGEYVYRGKRFTFLINGQTGEIHGEKPRDQVKIAAIVASVILTVMAIALIALLVFGR